MSARGRKRKQEPISVVVKEKPPTCCCCCCSENLEETSYQLVFDSSGLELGLPNLLLDIFSLNLTENKNEIQAVCFECLNDLIDSYDVNQKAKQESEIIKVEEDIKIEKISSEDDDQSEYEFIGFDEEIKEEPISEESIREEYFEEDYLEDPEEELINNDGDEKLSLLLDEADEASGEELVEAITGEIRKTNDEKIEEEKSVEVYIDYLDGAVPENFDFKSYKASILRSTFQDICFPSPIECRICSEKLTKHEDILKHTAEQHCVEDLGYPCIVDTACETPESNQDLSFHLVFKHYDLHSLTIYVQCPHCKKRFDNFILFNKHSCLAGKNISRSTTECEQCGNKFTSNKRYRFHLQFHMEHHRPMGCFICDIMIPDGDKFYEHIQYEHETDLSLICIVCDKQFNSEKNLRDHERAHKTVRPYQCKDCPKAYMDNQMLRDHITAHHSKNPFKCHICNKQLYKKTLLKKHIMSHEKPEYKDTISCSICGLVPQNEEDGQTHINEHHEEYDVAEMEIISIDVAYACEYCENAFKDPESLRLHRILHKKKIFMCYLCPLAYDEYKKLKTHKLTHMEYVDIRTTFPIQRQYMCDIMDCTKSYLHWTSLRSHKRNKHDNKDTITCKECGEVFKTESRYKIHVTRIHGDITYNCQFCGNTYSSKMALSVHVARKHNSVRIKCDECDSEYSNRYDLNRHKASTHKAYKCECGKILKTAKNLQVHQQMVHEKVKRFFCKTCGKGYFNNCDRSEHEKTVHSRMKRFECTLCDYKAIYKQSLSIHMRAHRNETPYECTICRKAFRRSYGLTLHMRRHNNNRNFKCPFEECDCAYPTQGILNAHMRTKHVNGMPAEKTKRRRRLGSMSKSRDAPRATIFVDDDDGLDDGVIGEPLGKRRKSINSDSVFQEGLQDEEQEEEEEEGEDIDDPITYVLDPAVVVQKNETDHDYIVRLGTDKIFGTVIEEYEIVDTDEITHED